MVTDTRAPDPATPAVASGVPEKPSIDGLEEKWIERWASEDTYAFHRDAALDPATPRQVYAAMLSGPGNMPVFADSQLSPQEKRDVIAYIETVEDTGAESPGGHRLGGFGPVPEGFVAFAIGLAALVGFTLWIGSRQ